MPLMIAALVLSLWLQSSPSTADELYIPIGQQAQLSQLPRNGQSSREVLEHFGLPQKEYPAVGKPPIIRWDYPVFSVYFEGTRVISSVVQHRPQYPTSAQGLQP